MILLQLFYEFFKIGLFAVGGGLATIPFLYSLTDKYPTWFSKEILGDMIAIAESTPGPVGVNMATYAGINAFGSSGGMFLEKILGGITATIGLVFPSVIVIIIVSKIFEKFRDNIYVENAFSGIRPAVTGMIAASGVGILFLALFGDSSWQTLNIGNFSIKAGTLFVLTLAITNKTKLHPIFFILAGGVIGAIFSF